VLAKLIESSKLEKRDEWYALSCHSREIPSEYSEAVDDMISRVETGENMGISVGEFENSALAVALTERGILYELDGGVLVTSERAGALIRKLMESFAENGFTLGELRDFLAVSRKTALKWAEFFDSQGWTLRKGDRRICK